MTQGHEGRALDTLHREGALEGLPVEVVRAGAITGHASRRRFFRVSTADSEISRVLVVYPERQPDELDRYVRTNRWFAEAGVRVPEVLSRGTRSLLVEDGGDALLDTEPSSAGARLRCYRQGIDAVVRLQHRAERVALPNPEWALDQQRLRAELQFAEQHAISGWLGAVENAAARSEAFDRLADAAARLPRAGCHRDFHARNLLVCADRLIVLDFQDVMLGPFLYDVASLLWDNYCDLPHATVADLLSRFWAERSVPLHSYPDATVPQGPPGLPPAARQAFCVISLQRSIKALGTFGYQVGVAGNAQYARYVPRTWLHVQRAARELGWHDLLAAMPDFDALPA